MCEAETLHCFLEEGAIIRGGYYQTCIKAHHQAPPSNQLLNFLSCSTRIVVDAVVVELD